MARRATTSFYDTDRNVVAQPCELCDFGFHLRLDESASEESPQPTDIKHTPLFPLGPDTTPYKKIMAEGVRVEKVLGGDMLVVSRMGKAPDRRPAPWSRHPSELGHTLISALAVVILGHHGHLPLAIIGVGLVIAAADGADNPRADLRHPRAGS